MKKIFRKFAPYAAGFLASVSPLSTAIASGPGDLLVSPVRVVFEARDRVAEVTLVNKAETKAVYRVSFENRRMNEDGTFTKIEEPGEGDLFADKMVRYAPRRIELEPNAPQTLRLMLRKPAELGEGEYRSHLHFAAVPDDAGSNSIDVQNGDADGISIQLTPVYGVTIPIIVRHGDLNVDVGISEVDYKQKADKSGLLSFTFSREGTKSLYGDFGLYEQGSDKPLVQKRGVALYTPNESRKVHMEVAPAAIHKMKGKSLELRFQDKTISGQDSFASVMVGPLTW